MKRIVGISLALLWLCTACDTSSEPTLDTQNPATASIAHLKTYCKGNTTVIAEEMTICGIVTANDIRGEFSQTLIVEDATAGIEISVDRTMLADLFPLGAAITVSCTGLAVGEYGGKVRLGAKPSGSYSVDRIPGEEVGRYIRCTAQNAFTRRPRTVSLRQITLADTDTYVHFNDVCFAEAGQPWCDTNPDTGKIVASLRTLIDSDGNTLVVRVPAQCMYAIEPIPEGTGSVNGIVDYFNGEFSLRIVNYEIDFSISATPPTAYLSTAECSAPTPTR